MATPSEHYQISHNEFGVRGATSANPSTPNMVHHKSKHIFEYKQSDQPMQFQTTTYSKDTDLLSQKTIVLSPAANPINTKEWRPQYLHKNTQNPASIVS